MATVTEAIRAELTLDASGLRTGLRNATSQVKTSTGQMTGQMSKLRSAVGLAVSAFGGFAIAGVAAKHIFNVNRETQTLMASLRSATGSAEDANRAFLGIKEFAATTPFQVSQVADAFIKLKNLGLDPSAAAMRSYGNTAAAMGKSMNQMIEAVADASTMEFERLKEFGIKAKQQADTVTFTFQGVATTVKKNAADITKFLRTIGDDKFGDAMAQQMNTINGAISNTRDNIDEIARIIGEGGLNTAVMDVIVSFRDWTAELAKTPERIKAIIDQTVQLGRVITEIAAIYAIARVAAAGYTAATVTATGATVTFASAVRGLLLSTGIGGLAVAAGLLVEFLVPWEKLLATKPDLDDFKGSLAGVNTELRKLTDTKATITAILLATGNIPDPAAFQRLEQWIDILTNGAKDAKDDVKAVGTAIEELPIPPWVEGTGTNADKTMHKVLTGVDALRAKYGEIIIDQGVINQLAEEWEQTLQDATVRQVQETQRAATEVERQAAAAAKTAGWFSAGSASMTVMQIASHTLVSNLKQAELSAQSIAKEITKAFAAFGVGLIPGVGPLLAPFVDFFRHGTTSVPMRHARAGMPTVPNYPGGGGTPIMAHSGEGILTKRAVRALGPENVIGLNRSPETFQLNGGMTINVYASGATNPRSVGEEVRRTLPGALNEAIRMRRFMPNG
jgi:hypothetical protein